ncbi:hypothetical protein K505DRAFT_3872 [Melanomma pulvis-pyrius CBS 109.77]|uniref:Uncharacterized protein n=1 Tax=Melanomma pulvis-pyrius CBS 109.77 TaxID=1314802 RepID=A0A6A6XI65_9PLEO|nr:hypothetical protein K505DRAFT_3872 [Melanomma pulvis-pyrius CBS 109.77]
MKLLVSTSSLSLPPKAWAQRPIYQREIVSTIRCNCHPGESTIVITPHDPMHYTVMRCVLPSTYNIIRPVQRHCISSISAYFPQPDCKRLVAPFEDGTLTIETTSTKAQ